MTSPEWPRIVKLLGIADVPKLRQNIFLYLLTSELCLW